MWVFFGMLLLIISIMLNLLMVWVKLRIVVVMKFGWVSGRIMLKKWLMGFVCRVVVVFSGFLLIVLKVFCNGCMMKGSE